MFQFFLAWLVPEPHPHLLHPALLLHPRPITLSSPPLQKHPSPASKPLWNSGVLFCLAQITWESRSLSTPDLAQTRVPTRVRSTFGCPPYGPSGQKVVLVGDVVLVGRCHKPIWGTTAVVQSKQLRDQHAREGREDDFCEHLWWSSCGNHGNYEVVGWFSATWGSLGSWSQRAESCFPKLFLWQLLSHKPLPV